MKELLGIPDDKTYRVTFNEITKKVVNESIASPRAIDQNLVDAQQARRILDRIVGYELSPCCGRRSGGGLSAYRVQSVPPAWWWSGRREIRAFQPQEYWSIQADLGRVRPNLGGFQAMFHGREKKMELHSEAGGGRRDPGGVGPALHRLQGEAAGQAAQPRAPLPPPPSSRRPPRKLNMTPARTMSIAQQLYEGVDITGEGTVGLITYMRTDSLPPVGGGHRRGQGFY